MEWREIKDRVAGKRIVSIESDASDYNLKGLYPDAVSRVRVTLEDGSVLEFTSSDLIDDNSVECELIIN